jgi:hypothetical protein
MDLFHDLTPSEAGGDLTMKLNDEVSLSSYPSLPSFPVLIPSRNVLPAVISHLPLEESSCLLPSLSESLVSLAAMDLGISVLSR